MRILAKITPLFAFLIIAFSAHAQVQQITPDEAYAKALAGDIVLIDIRTPEEWAETGVADVALQDNLYAPDFIQTLLAIRNQNPAIPLALICHSGSRSGNATGQLYKAGLTDVIDVVEGMGGSGVGPGYIARGLPMRANGTPVNPAVTTVQP